MPIYEYRCESCGKETDKIQGFSDPPLVQCPACGQDALKRLISMSSFHLKGGGWYVTDYKGGGAGAAKDAGAKGGGKESTSGSGDASSSSSSSSSGETSSAGASEAKPAATESKSTAGTGDAS